MSADNGESYSEFIPVFYTPIDDRDVGLTPFGKNSLTVTSFNNTIDTRTGEATLQGCIPSDEFTALNLYEPYAMQLPDGKIICHIRVENNEETIFTIYQTVSFDKAKPGLTSSRFRKS